MKILSIKRQACKNGIASIKVLEHWFYKIVLKIHGNSIKVISNPFETFQACHLISRQITFSHQFQFMCYLDGPLFLCLVSYR
jgi:hypothetical protein